MLQINEVLKMDETFYRILVIFLEDIAWIPIEGDKVFPSIITKDELYSAIENESCIHVEDPYAYLTYETPEEKTVAREKRDKNFKLIETIIKDEQALIPEIRSERINKVIETKGSTKQTLYRLLRRYWQRGQTANALIPDYKNSGAKEKSRVASKGKKLGRPRTIMRGVGVNIDDFVEKLFRQVIEKYLLKEEKISLPYAHRKLKTIYETYFPDLPEYEMPTIWQMKHFYKREYKQVEVIQARATKINYQKDINPLISTATADVMGPGSRYEIDATIADIYVVSNSERRNIIGRPVIYMIIDVFSRMVVGMYVGLESPSYVTAMQALSNAVTDKVDYCKKYGIEIEDEDWPVKGLPDAILGDRGELLGFQIEALETNFSVRIENTPPYRGDAKGIVERRFGTLHAKFKPFAPGVVTETTIKKRGGKDYRLDAKLTINEFIEIILESVLYHNRYKTLKKYDRSIDMPTDLILTPLSIWNWGIQNRTGKLRAANIDAVNITLLPRKKVSISELGIRIFGIFYTCKEILKQGWLHRSKEINRPQNLYAAYDPRTANHIYLFPKQNNSEYWVCDLTQRSREFMDSSFWDVWQITLKQKKVMSISDDVSEKEGRNLENSIDQKIQKAKKQSTETSDQSSAQRIREIRPNRQKAKEQERQDTAYHPKKTIKEKSAQIIHLAEPEEDGSYPDLIDELFDEDE